MYRHFLIIILAVIISCSSSRIAGEAVSTKASKQLIDSLVLVKYLPVYIISTDSLFKPAILLGLKDSLTQRGFQFKSRKEVNALQAEFMNEAAGVGNTEKMLEVMEKSKQDKEYFLKLAERADPYVQRIIFQPCGGTSGNCIAIERRNPPNERKKKSWVFEYKETDKSGKLINQIIEALTAQNPSQ